MTDDRATRFELHPSDAHRIRKYAGSATVDEVAIRPSRELLLRVALRWLVVAGLIVFLVPACAVVVRKEPGYFTDGITLTALIAAVALVALGMAAVWIWSITGRRRAEYSTPSAVLGPDGVTLPAHRGRPEVSAPWSDVAWARLVGRGERLLAIGIEPASAADSESAQDSAATGASDSSADDFDTQSGDWLSEPSPTPPTVQPSREVFAQLTEPPSEAPVGSSAEVTVDVEQDDRPTVTRAAESPWNTRVHGTPHVVDLTRSRPSADVIAGAFRDFTDGRLDLR